MSSAVDKKIITFWKPFLSLCNYPMKEAMTEKNLDDLHLQYFPSKQLAFSFEKYSKK